MTSSANPCMPVLKMGTYFRKCDEWIDSVFALQKFPGPQGFRRNRGISELTKPPPKCSDLLMGMVSPSRFETRFCLRCKHGYILGKVRIIGFFRSTMPFARMLTDLYSQVVRRSGLPPAAYGIAVAASQWSRAGT